MKTLLLSNDDIQNFSKLIYDPKAAQLASDATQAASCNLMALQYYLKHPTNYPTSANQQTQVHIVNSHSQQQQQQPNTLHQLHHQQQQQMLAQSQTQLKQLQLKQPTIHPQHSSYLHHPYYQQPAPPPIATTNYVSSVPVHALNQNSNFSAASSSTGGSSSNAPTQQSNATGSSLSPGAAKSKSGSSAYANANAPANSNVRTSIVSGTKKLKTEPLLSQFHQTERYTFANTHLVWSEDNWKRVVFQDERKFNLDGPDGFSYYFHDLRNYERTLSQRPRGNSVYIYFVITAGGPIHIEVSTSKLKPETCIETILRERANIVEKLSGNSDFVLQDHNWSVNAVPTAQNWLSSEGIKTQKWPTIAHDLNIMENIWGWLIREVYEGGRKFSRKDDLIFRIREAWSRLPMDLVNNLYSTLPERITELYYTRGVYTNC